MDIEPSFETNAYLSKAGKPSVRALNHPPVTAQALPALDALAGDPGPYAAPLQILPTSAAVVRPGSKLSLTIASFSSTDHRRRRSGPVNTSITSCLLLVINTVVCLPVSLSG